MRVRTFTISHLRDTEAAPSYLWCQWRPQREQGQMLELSDKYFKATIIEISTHQCKFVSPLETNEKVESPEEEIADTKKNEMEI